MIWIALFLLCFTQHVEAKKILFVGGIHEGKEEIFHQKREDKNTVLQGYFEAWGQIIEELKKRGVDVDFCTHQFVRDRLLKSPKSYDLYIFQNHKIETNRTIEKRSFLILFESIAVLPLQFHRKVIDRYAKVFSWHDELVKKGKAVKFCYPVWKAFAGQKPFSEKKGSCMMAAHKQSSYPHELYKEREKIIEHYKNSPLFDLYGQGWEDKQYSIYRGTSQDKLGDLQKYRFVYCLENSFKENPGYITEKLFDAFAAGTIPIYLGPPNVDQYIPSSCYIDYSRFTSLEELDRFLSAFTEEEYQKYIANIQEFLNSEAAKRFTPSAFAQIMLPEILHYLEEK